LIKNQPRKAVHTTKAVYAAIVAYATVSPNGIYSYDLWSKNGTKKPLPAVDKKLLDSVCAIK
jgi:hypothetical protein